MRLTAQRPVLFLAAASLFVGCGDSPRSSTANVDLTYPETRRVDVDDTYHGTTVPDPYRWLEELDSDDVAAWVEEQNAVTDPYLDALPLRDALQADLTALLDYERYTIPVVRGERLFYSYNNGLQDQDVWYVQDTPDAEPRELIDPNTLSEDATVALAVTTFSPNGRYMAYGLSDGGTDWRIWHVRDVETGEDMTDVIRGAKFSDPIAWTHDEKGFYYTRYPRRADGTFDDSRQASIFYHELGGSPEDDALIYELTRERFPTVKVTNDGRYLVIRLFAYGNGSEIYVLDLSTPSRQIVPIVDTMGAQYEILDNDGDAFYMSTNRDAPLGRIVRFNLSNPDPSNWVDVVPEAEARLESASLTGGRLFVQYLDDVKSNVRVFDTSGALVRDVELPGIGSAYGFDGGPESTHTYFAFASFTTPGTIYRYNVTTGSRQVWRESVPTGFDPDEYSVEQVFYSSADGTRIPMFVIHRADLDPGLPHPTMLYGYGGFNISLVPEYIPYRMAWLAQGGVYAISNLRGGGEYGREWHMAGTRLDKQNVFDDFIAAAEYLIYEGFTQSSQLTIAGRSNGGLLVAAVMNQRPDLAGAALPDVGVLDMLRYHTASANARQWSADYGLSENPDEFEALYAYSPVHTVEDGTCYPPTLVTTADHDDRVVPWHSFKYAAALQHAQGCEEPVLLRVETRAGHGAGMPTSMRIEKVADQYAFALHHTTADH